MDERVIYEILSVVEEIPEGKVATYGQIAKLIGRDRNARLVGRVLATSLYWETKTGLPLFHCTLSLPYRYVLE